MPIYIIIIMLIPAAVVDANNRVFFLIFYYHIIYHILYNIILFDTTHIHIISEISNKISYLLLLFVIQLYNVAVDVICCGSSSYYLHTARLGAVNVYCRWRYWPIKNNRRANKRRSYYTWTVVKINRNVNIKIFNHNLGLYIILIYKTYITFTHCVQRYLLKCVCVQNVILLGELQREYI